MKKVLRDNYFERRKVKTNIFCFFYTFKLKEFIGFAKILIIRVNILIGK